MSMNVATSFQFFCKFHYYTFASEIPLLRIVKMNFSPVYAALLRPADLQALSRAGSSIGIPYGKKGRCHNLHKQGIACWCEGGYQASNYCCLSHFSLNLTILCLRSFLLRALFGLLREAFLFSALDPECLRVCSRFSTSLGVQCFFAVTHESAPHLFLQGSLPHGLTLLFMVQVLRAKVSLDRNADYANRQQ